LVTDPEVAKQMGISTEPNQAGDLYLIRKASKFTAGVQPNIKIRDYDYISEKLMSYQELADEPEKC